MALIERRRLMIELSEEHLPQDLDFDDDYANYVTVLLGQVINQCFGNDVDPIQLSRWTSLENSLETWKTRLPSSFAPIIIRNEGVFPLLGALHGWHGWCKSSQMVWSTPLILGPVAALQYYQAAGIILQLAKPRYQVNTTMENIRQITCLNRDLESRAWEICALALSSESQAVWINAFGPIAFCECCRAASPAYCLAYSSQVAAGFGIKRSYRRW